MNRICGWKRGVATGVEIFANDSGGNDSRTISLPPAGRMSHSFSHYFHFNWA
jgi:hypothetical protein